MTTAVFDFIVLGSGPAGQKAAIQAAKAGAQVLVVEQGQHPGGACVHRGTIPSKTLRETAIALGVLRRRSGGILDVTPPAELKLASLMTRLDQVVGSHQAFIADQLERNGIALWHGRARFLSPHLVEVTGVDGARRVARGTHVVIATGSRPRNPADVPIDHENVLDSDSILSLTYLPRSLAVIGSGVIATEYACIFAALGVRVTMIDRSPRPLAFLDEELVAELSRAFAAEGGTYLGGRAVRTIAWDGVEVTTTLDDGRELRADKLLYCLGREANLTGLGLEAAGLAATPRGLLEVDPQCRTAVPHIYAVGDVIGPPSLASTAMEQGRRAVCHALGLALPASASLVPSGVYAIPELAMVGLTEAQAIERHGSAVVGRARFGELARGQIAAIEDGLLKLVCDPAGRRVLGVHVVGEGAAELVHIGQIAMIAGWEVEAFVDNIFNFPTLGEAYRVAALDVLKRRLARAA
ncbi:MAG: Si-specific NAD(P)(+) transhydrogenase [Myxococcales bacterium]|nr:Si-specific NAD(P)(+) transhydrogenase [Myxococcales bacterium]